MIYACSREKMVGVNLHENNPEAPWSFGLKGFPRVDTNGDPPLSQETA